MTGIDSNVLLRAILNDDPEQGALARQLLARGAGEGGVLINHLVIVETVWTLRRIYRYPRAALLEVIGDLTRTAGIVIQDPSAVTEALATCRDSDADLPDALIGAINRRAGCTTTYTFDRAAAAQADLTAVPGS